MQESTSEPRSASHEIAETPPANSNQPPLPNRKIVCTAEVDLVVEDFEPVQGKIDATLGKFGAFVAHSNVSGSAGSPRRGEWVIRVPVENYRELLAAARELGETRSVRSDSRDVTEEYYDVEARIRNKRQEEDRLLKLLETAAGSLKDVLEIERELSRVREEIERMQGRLRVLEDITELSTITLRVEEVKDFVPPQTATYATRVRRTFEESLGTLVKTVQSATLVVIALAPWAAVLAVVGLPVFAGVKLRNAARRRAAR
ncbi:MAG: DUF4349 domain-containing protein [Pirellulales bacterium]|nr:DUF4349 domain-containing protein [Pirellulales bacterium]